MSSACPDKRAVVCPKPLVKYFLLKGVSATSLLTYAESVSSAGPRRRGRARLATRKHACAVDGDRGRAIADSDDPRVVPGSASPQDATSAGRDVNPANVPPHRWTPEPPHAAETQSQSHLALALAAADASLPPLELGAPLAPELLGARLGARHRGVAAVEGDDREVVGLVAKGDVRDAMEGGLDRVGRHEGTGRSPRAESAVVLELHPQSLGSAPNGFRGAPSMPHNCERPAAGGRSLRPSSEHAGRASARRTGRGLVAVALVLAVGLGLGLGPGVRTSGGTITNAPTDGGTEAG